MHVRKSRFVIDMLGHQNLDPNVVFETLELYIYRPSISACSSRRRRRRRRRRAVSVRPVVRPVVGRALFVRPVVSAPSAP